TGILEVTGLGSAQGAVDTQRVVSPEPGEIGVRVILRPDILHQFNRLESIGPVVRSPEKIRLGREIPIPFPDSLKKCRDPKSLPIRCQSKPELVPGRAVSDDPPVAGIVHRIFALIYKPVLVQIGELEVPW